ncbi:FliA/WhiG family RNA polymerase sigma factor [Mucisphaera sp.]|uniref:FliA/WhiG family RNA polymerase sigma factor n=1 Tax=Mucisphaera sp. TaxID=2913024 RepID=UPI003D0D84E2
MPATKNASKTAVKKKATASARAAHDEQIREVWLEYKSEPNEDLRNQLIEAYLHLVKYNAERIHAKLPDEVDIEDLMSVGVFGLMDAIDLFDLNRGVKFETYCATRIRGAILDELRSMDWVPRLVRSRTSQVQKVTNQIQKEFGRPATRSEIRERLGVNEEEYDKIERDAGATSVVSLSRKYFETDSNKDVREIDVLEDGRQVNPFQMVQKRDLKNLITKGLSRAERLIIILYYYEEMTMKEIGMTLDLSESRVSQMHSSILARLKAQLQHRSGELQAEAT